MPNSNLENKSYILTDEILNNLKNILSKYKNHSESGGYKRLNGIINNPNISYQQMKRIKNYFDTFNGEPTDVEYILNGGEIMRDWVESSLGDDRNRINTDKTIRKNAGEKNQFRKPHTKDSKIMDRDYLLDKLSIESIIKEDVDKIKKMMNYINNIK